MITREEILELAKFQVAAEACALSFYFQPQRPQNKSHREEAILAKDLVRQALREAEKNGRNGIMREDLDRILDLAGHLHGNQARAKAVFACIAKNFWREFDLPPQLPATQLFLNDRFHLKPLAALLGAQPRLWVVLVDRRRGRFFELRLDELAEREGVFHELPRRGRSDGFAGYDGGHAERRLEDDAMHHFKKVAERLKDAHEKGHFERLIIGCQESLWPEFEPHLHPYVKQRLLEHFPADMATIASEQIRERAQRILLQWQESRRQSLVREVLGQAQRNANGVTGLRRVLEALELGEVQILLLGEKFRAPGVECRNCGHLDAHIVPSCPLCAHSTRELVDVCDAIVPQAICRDIELFYVKDDASFDRVGNIGALLRFRVDQNKPSILAAS
ncbi:MAG: host attachment protein [Acidobacteria bacterium]|nr:host attachment protein [Acidobacteriota bacterium]